MQCKKEAKLVPGWSMHKELEEYFGMSSIDGHADDELNDYYAES